MALSQTGANYKNRAHILSRDRLLGEALDDITSKAQAALTQGNFGVNGTPAPPGSPSAVSVSTLNGTITANIVHPKAPTGTQWVLQYSTSPEFTDPVTVGLLHPIWQAYLPNQTLFVRVAAKFPASAQSAWVEA
jgi:hypothetical protein